MRAIKSSKKPTQMQVLMLAYLSIWFIKQYKNEMFLPVNTDILIHLQVYE